MRIVAFGEAPAPTTPRRRVIPQSSSPARELGTFTKTTARRRSVLTDSIAPASSKQITNRKGKQPQDDQNSTYSDSDRMESISRTSSTESGAGSLKENGSAEGGIVRSTAMDLVTSTSTGSLIHQAVADATLYEKRPKRRKAARKIPLHGKCSSATSKHPITCT